MLPCTLINPEGYITAAKKSHRLFPVRIIVTHPRVVMQAGG
jgi:hypothetical protein